MVHTSGIQYPPDLGEEPMDEDCASYLKLQVDGASGKYRNLRSFVDALAKLPLRHHPGYKYNYGLSYDVLGRVLEVIVGKPLDKVLEERVFKPLGMKDTLWAVPDSQLAQLAACYASKHTWTHLY